MTDDTSLIEIPATLCEQLRRLLPVEAKHLLPFPVVLSMDERTALLTHLTRLWQGLSAAVPAWLLRSTETYPMPLVHLSNSTLLFADVSGFTPLTERLGSFSRSGNEAVVQAINQVFTTVIPIALARNGDVLAFGGDAVLVAFNDPEHAATALIVAWEMQEALATYSVPEIDGAPEPIRLHMKIGLASGQLSLTTVGVGSQRVPLAMGNLLTTTDTIAAKAASGTIRTDQQTAEAAAMVGEFSLQADGSYIVTGLRERLPVPPRASVERTANIRELAERIVAVVPYVSPGVLAMLTGATPVLPGDGEQRYNITLFSHLTGLHALADAWALKESQRVADTAEFVVGEMLAMLEGHGGMIARIDTYTSGHKFLVLFGVPVAYERSAERAVRAALAIRRMQAKLTSDLPEQLPLPVSSATTSGTVSPSFTIRTGIDAGPVVAGVIGSPQRWEYTVMGASVNTAARLMASANTDQNEVLIGSSVMNRLGAMLSGEQRQIHLRGMSAPMSVWAVHQIDDLPRPPLLPEPPFVGREAEQHMLQRRIQSLHAGCGGTVLIQGEAGIGKSRLMRDMLGHCESGIMVIQTGSPGVVSSRLSVVQAFVLALCRHVVEPTTASLADQLRTMLELLCPEQHTHLWSALAVVMEFDYPDDAIVGATLDAQQRTIVWVIRSLLNGAAARQPLIWICEDLHAIDAASVAILEAVLSEEWKHPWLFCATLRLDKAKLPHTITPLINGIRQIRSDSVTVVELAGLGLDAGSTLLAELLPGLSPNAESALHAYAGGNPLFLQVLAQAVHEQRLLTPSSQGYRLHAPLSTLGLPQTLQELVATQLDRLPAEVRRLAQTMAVIGQADRNISRSLLEAIADDPHVVLPRLRDLEQKHVVEAVDIEGNSYSFRHALYQRAAYDQLLERERRDLHRRTGLALHRLKSTDQDVALESLAYHCYEGQCWELAVRYSLAAGQRAVQTYANREARRFLRWALVLARRFGWTEQETSAREGLGELYALLARYGLAQAHLMRSIRGSVPTISQPECYERLARRHRLLAMIAERTGDYGRAQEECHIGLSLLAEHAPSSQETMRLHIQLAEVYWRCGDFARAEQVCRSGLTAMTHTSEMLREKIALLQRLAFIEGQRGNYPQAIEDLEYSLAKARTIGDLSLLGQVLHNLGIYLFLAGQLEQAAARFEESLAVREQIGDMVGQIRTIEHLGGIHLMRGQYSAALQFYQNCCAMCTRRNMPQPLASATGNLGQLYYIQNQLGLAQEQLLQAHELYQSLGDPDGLADCLYRLGDVALAQNDPPRAYEYGQQALEQARAMQSKVYEACALRVMGEALHAQGKLPEAADTLDQARQIQEQIDGPYDLVLLLRAQARLAYTLGDRSGAAALAHLAHESAQQQQMPYLIGVTEQLCQEVGARDVPDDQPAT